MILNQENIKRFSEACAKVGTSIYEAAQSLQKAVEDIISAEFVNAIADLVAGITYPSDEQLRALATDREWHLMKNAKKYRTRNKYRNRIIKRYINELLTEKEK